MPGTTSPFGITYSSPTDKIKEFPTQVSKPAAETINKVFSERLLSIKEHGSSFTAASGELVKCTGLINITLPSPTVNTIIGVLANGFFVKILAGSAKIYGDYIVGESEVQINGQQHLIFYADGASWFITAGEAKRKQEYSAAKFYTKTEVEAGVEASSTRSAFVLLTSVEKISNLEIGAQMVGALESGGEIGFELPAGQKWKLKSPCFASVLLK